jgi:hypothetical protein
MVNFESVKNFSVLGLLFFVVVSCKPHGSRSNSTTLKSPDGKVQLTVLDGWTAQGPLGEGEIIKAANDLGDMAIIVSAKRKANLADDMTLDKYTEIGRNQLLAAGTAAEITKPESLTVNGYAARRYEGTTATKYICLVTAVETPENFHRIIACAPTSKYEQNKAAFKQMSDTFRAVLAPSSSH